MMRGANRKPEQFQGPSIDTTRGVRTLLLAGFKDAIDSFGYQE